MMKAVFKGVCEHIHCGINPLELFRAGCRGPGLALLEVGHLLHQCVSSAGVFCGSQIQRTLPERTRKSLQKMASTGKKPQGMYRICILHGAGMG